MSLYLRGTKSGEPNTRPPGCATPQQPTLHFVINKQNFDGKQGMKQHHDELGSQTESRGPESRGPKNCLSGDKLLYVHSLMSNIRIFFKVQEEFI